MAKKKTQRGRLSKTEVDFILKHSELGVQQLSKETGRSVDAVMKVLNSVIVEKKQEIQKPAYVKKDLTGHRKGATIMTPAASENYDAGRNDRGFPRNQADYIRSAKDD